MNFKIYKRDQISGKPDPRVSDSDEERVQWASDLVRKLSAKAKSRLSVYDNFTIDIIIMDEDRMNQASPWCAEKSHQVSHHDAYLPIDITNPTEVEKLHLGTVMWCPSRTKTANLLSAPMALYHEILHLLDFRENLKTLITGNFFVKGKNGGYGQFTEKAISGGLDNRILDQEREVAQQINDTIKPFLSKSRLSPSERVALLEPIRLDYRDLRKIVIEHRLVISWDDKERPEKFDAKIEPGQYEQFMNNILAGRVPEYA